jgi:hypothetical protein
MIFFLILFYILIMNALIYYLCFYHESNRTIMKMTLQRTHTNFTIGFWKCDDYDIQIRDSLDSVFDITVFGNPMKLFFSGPKVTAYGESQSFYGQTLDNSTIESFLCIGCQEDQCNQLAHTCLGYV